MCSAWEDDTEKKISPRLEFRDGFRAKKGFKRKFSRKKKSSNRKTNWGVDSEHLFGGPILQTIMKTGSTVLGNFPLPRINWQSSWKGER